MRRVEEQLEVESEASEEFRHTLIGKIAGHALGHPGEQVDYGRLFPQYIEKLRDAYYADRRRQVGAIAFDVLTVLDEGPGLSADRRDAAQRTVDSLFARFAYEATSLREAIGELVRERYAP